MKIPVKRTKKGVKASKPTTSKQVVDALGEEYESTNVIKKEASAKNSEATSKIKELARHHGKSDGERHILCHGDRYVIGFTETDPTPAIDVNLAEANFSPKDYKKCLVTKFDSALATRQFAAGKIDSVAFKASLVIPASQERIYVKEISS